MANAAVDPLAAVRNIPTFWFGMLERAREQGDKGGADRARRELNRLGVDVAYKSKRPEVRKAVAHGG